MGQSRRPTNRAAKAPLKISPRKRGHTDKLPLLLLTGFEPFGKERINPSWEIVRHLDGLVIGGFRIKSKRLPVAFSRAGRAMVSAIRRLRPAAVLALGQAGGRTAISVEHIAINLIDERSKDNSGRRAAKRTIVAG